MEELEENKLPCFDKITYNTQKEARTASTVLRFQRNSRLKAYRCKYCDLWHLASNYDEK